MKGAGSRAAARRLAVGVLLLAAVPARAADWPRWRGPLSDGRASTAERLPLPLAPAIAWQRPLGIGYSAVVVAGDRAVTMYAEDETDFVIALDAATGETVWRHPIDAWFPPKGGSSGGAKSTPTIDEGVVYALGPKGHLLAVRLADGAELWRHPLVESAGAVMPEFGFATSPLVVGDVVVVQTGGAGGHSVTGFDKITGGVRWATGDDSSEYQSPTVAELGGRTQVVALTDHRLAGLDPVNGATLWSHAYALGSVPIAVPLGGDRLLLAGDEGAVAVEVRAVDGGFGVAQQWATHALRGSLAAPVALGDYAFGYAGDFLSCVAAGDGARAWRSRPPGGGGVIAVDGKLIVTAKGGAVVVADAAAESYRELARIDVFDRSGYTYPTFAGGRIFVRNTREIAAVSLDGTRAGPPRGAFSEWLRTWRMRLARPFHELERWFWGTVRRHLAPGPPAPPDDGAATAR